jgi:hypothetical protein
MATRNRWYLALITIKAVIKQLYDIVKQMEKNDLVFSGKNAKKDDLVNLN